MRRHVRFNNGRTAWLVASTAKRQVELGEAEYIDIDVLDATPAKKTSKKKSSVIEYDKLPNGDAETIVSKEDDDASSEPA